MKEFVYIVDDDEAVRDSLRWLLEGNGFSVRVFKSCFPEFQNRIIFFSLPPFPW